MSARNVKMIGQGLKKIREKKGMSREELAMYTGLAERTIQNIELGYNLSSKSLELYLEALAVKGCDFYV